MKIIKKVVILFSLILAFITANAIIANASDDFSTAINLSLNNQVSGTLSETTKAFYYSFTTTNNDSYYMFEGINSTGSNTKSFTVYDSSYTEVKSFTVSISDKESIYIKLNPNAKYYVLVKTYIYSSGYGDFKLKVSETTDNSGDDFSKSSNISLSNEVSGSIEVSSDVDYFKFTTSEGDYFYKIDIINSTGSSFFDTYIYDNDYVSYDNFYIAKNSESYQIYKLATNKTYYIKLSNYYGSTGAYKLTVSKIQDDAGDTSQSANTISLNQTVSHVIQSSSDLDYYKFNTNGSTKSYTITISDNNTTDYNHLQFYLYDKNMLKLDEEYFSYQTSPKSISYTLSKNATYYIKMSGKENVKYNIKVTYYNSNEYKITYKLNGGTNNKSNPSTYLKSKSVTLKNPTRKDYIFKGWYASKSFTNKITKISKGSAKNYTLYAKWEKVSVSKAGISQLENSKANQLSIKINKSNDVKGYEITYATNSNFTSNKEIVTISGTNKTISNLAKNSTYYVKVRAYKTDSADNKVYGSYSSVKKIKLKK